MGDRLGPGAGEEEAMVASASYWGTSEEMTILLSKTDSLYRKVHHEVPPDLRTSMF